MRLFPQNKKNRNKVSNHSSTDSSASKNNSYNNTIHKNKKIADTIPPAAAAEPSLKTRRIVKATTPSSAPPATTTASSSSFHSRNTESFSDELRMVHDDDNIRIPERSFVGIKAPAVQQEELQEKVQQWRKERLEASAAIRKEHKEKEIKEHRMRNLTSSSLESHDYNHVDGEQDDQHDHDDNNNNNNKKDSNSDGNSGGDQGGLDKKTVLKHKEPTSHQDRHLSIFSVLPKFPEHKRKKASHDHDTFKKLKTAEEELQELNSKKEEDNVTGTGTGTGTGNSNGNDTIHYDKTFCISNKKELACEWKKFVNGVSKNDIDHDKNDIDDDNNEANHDNERDGTSTRRVLYKYYNALLGPDPLARAKAARSWFQWEMSVASLSIELDVKNGELGDVIVWNGARRVWVVKQGNDDQVVGTQKYHNKYLDFLRKWPKLSSDTMMLDSPCRPTGIQPLISQQPVRCEDGNDKSHSDAKETTAAETFIPAQAMLTCFYSVNQEFIMENFDLLKNENIERIRHIPCIAVQGAKDMICPPDSALDLVEAWPEMECRFVTEGKHSMYDPRIMSELIEATDDVACRLSSVQHLRTVN